MTDRTLPDLPAACIAAQDRMIAVLDGSDPDEATLHDHLAGCGLCRAAWSELQQVASRLSDAGRLLASETRTADTIVRPEASDGATQTMLDTQSAAADPAATATMVAGIMDRIRREDRAESTHATTTTVPTRRRMPVWPWVLVGGLVLLAVAVAIRLSADPGEDPAPAEDPLAATPGPAEEPAIETADAPADAPIDRARFNYYRERVRSLDPIYVQALPLRDRRAADEDRRAQLEELWAELSDEPELVRPLAEWARGEAAKLRALGERRERASLTYYAGLTFILEGANRRLDEEPAE